MTRNRETGFTVIELMLSMAVLGIIITSISGAMIVFLSNATYTTQRDDHSGGAAILATYIDRDLASAETATFDATVTCSAGTKDLLLRWDEWTASPGSVMPTPGPAYSAAYDLVADGAGGFQLERWYCRSSTPLSHSVLVRDLKSADFSKAPTAACGTGSTSLALQLRRYTDDSGRDYVYSGCLKGRVR